MQATQATYVRMHIRINIIMCISVAKKLMFRDCNHALQHNFFVMNCVITNCMDL